MATLSYISFLLVIAFVSAFPDRVILPGNNGPQTVVVVKQPGRQGIQQKPVVIVQQPGRQVIQQVPIRPISQSSRPVVVVPQQGPKVVVVQKQQPVLVVPSRKF
ncbi:unnamed protein product [Chironomus riparius]|uniref:Uncharacterized protein n=1 Tax=Chironomus riparius TaxID=315576 RepID=A0A9N9RHS3_9DIPT|nr:unnamed protein product [Chironomus riparius]